MVLTLNQRLGSFLTESMAAIFSLCRQNYPFPPTINRGGFHGLSMKKMGSKIYKKKTSHSLVPSQRFPLYFLSSPCLQPLKTPHKPFSSTNRRRLSLPTSLNPHQRHNSHRELLPLPYADFLLLLPLPLTANSSTVPRSDVARTISSAS